MMKYFALATLAICLISASAFGTECTIEARGINITYYRIWQDEMAGPMFESPTKAAAILNQFVNAGICKRPSKLPDCEITATGSFFHLWQAETEIRLSEDLNALTKLRKSLEDLKICRPHINKDAKVHTSDASLGDEEKSVTQAL